MSGIPLLFLRLEGPLQSWGLRARWDVRDTGDEPSKSGLIGLLGCALGYPVYDKRLEDLDRELTLGIRVENEGRKLVDFQTITGVLPTAEGKYKGKPDDPATIISPRTYLQDGAYLAVFAGSEPIIKQCAYSLTKPRWPIFLGRKSCPPTRPVFVAMTDGYSSIEDALKHYPWDWSGKDALPQGERPAKLRCVLEDPAGEAMRPDRIRTNPARMYDSRLVRVFSVDFPGETEEAKVCTSQN